MRRKVSAFFVVMLAMLLSVALAVPAHADASSEFWDNLSKQQKPGGTYQHKYGWDYYKAEWRATPGAPKAPGGFVVKQPVSPVLNPSANRVPATSNTPLTGKIIEPGKTLVRTPATYASTAKYAGLAGASRFLGMVGVGIGGTSPAPSNYKELSLSQGVTAGCVEGTVACTSDEIAKQFKISGCGQFVGESSCDAIGAMGPNGESLQTDWFRDEALPFLADLWEQITGQKGDVAPAPLDTHHQFVPRGCIKDVGFQYSDPNGGRVFIRGQITGQRPDKLSEQPGWDDACADLSRIGNTDAAMVTECIDPATGLFGSPTNGNSYGHTAGGASVGTFFDDQGVMRTNRSMCATPGPNVPASVRLFRVRIFNPLTQAELERVAGYSIANYFEWVNPDPGMNSIEDAKITTSYECRTSDGVIYTFSETIVKTAAFIAPSCPAGSELVRHDISSVAPDGTKTTLDAGAEVPGSMLKYPDCAAKGCALEVYVDGTACTPARSECQTWPAVRAVQPSRVVCKWGSYVVPSSDCNALSNGYKTETGVVFDPKSGTWVAIDIYGNPVAPNAEPWNPVNPNPTPGATPGTPTSTTPGTSAPGFPTTGTSPADGCVSPAWSWNPVDWVKNPVICALKDAFVPKTDIKTRMDTISTAAAGTVPISWISTPIIGPSGGGCPNWTVQVAGLSKNVVCESSFTAAVVGARGPMFGIVASAMIWPLLRSIWYALIPIVRVTPSGSR